MYSNKIFVLTFLSLLFLIAVLLLRWSPVASDIRIVNVSDGWANNSINTVIFRHNSVISHKDYQYVAFYDEQAHVILAKRKLNTSQWKIQKTRYTGNIEDAHNCISMMVDGEGYLHIAWDHHGSPLRYCRSKYPEELELTERMPMVGSGEQNVTYPEFYRLLNGNLIFLYRDGSSGNGNLVLNYYDTQKKTWSNLHKNLIDGEGVRNAYWQAAIGANGSIHISWVWRESWDVATNHDLCYAKSTDNGKTWRKSNGEKYRLPITKETAEYGARIEQGSELINQTSMCVDNEGHPYIASYWKPLGDSIPQYHLVYGDGKQWKVKQISERKTAFSLSGGGTKRIPISRPQILVDDKNVLYLIYRDIERNNLVSFASCDDIEKNTWKFQDLTTFGVGMWEPTYDTELWRSVHELHLFVQNVGQGDAESLEKIRPQMISILEWKGRK
jgi:hypothetical protein